MEKRRSKGLFGQLSGAASDFAGSLVDTVGKADFNLFSRSARIAIVGASRSGKTVLLTSLIDHLRNHDPRQFRLRAAPLSGKEAARIIKYETLPVNPGMAPFPFEHFRQSLIEDAHWPRKTKDTYQYRMKLYRDDNPFSKLVEARVATSLSFLDFPGERIADAPMTSLSYSDWSDYVLESLPRSGTFRELVSTYTEVQKNPSADESAILRAYKAILALRLSRFHTAISPSVFALCRDGTTPDRGAAADNLINGRLTGLSSERQFCPLSMEGRKANPVIAAKFEEAYGSYKSDLILPLYEALADSDKLCILVNIPEILQSGVEAYNDHIALLEQVVAFCYPRRSAYADILHRLTKSVARIFIDDRYRPGGLEKIAFVATQADRVRAEETNRLTRLVRELQKNSTRSLPHVDLGMESFSCVAVQATRPAGEGNLQGRLATRNEGEGHRQADPEEYTVSSLPEKWPAQWNPDDFVFPDVLPRFSQNRNVPPEQIGLDRVFNYLIS